MMDNYFLGSYYVWSNAGLMAQIRTVVLISALVWLAAIIVYGFVKRRREIREDKLKKDKEIRSKRNKGKFK